MAVAWRRWGPPPWGWPTKWNCHWNHGEHVGKMVIDHQHVSFFPYMFRQTWICYQFGAQSEEIMSRFVQQWWKNGGASPPQKKTKRQFHGKQICSAPWDFGVFPTFSDVAEGEQFLVHDWEHPGKSRSCRGCNSKWLALENQRRHGKPTIHDKMCGETMAFRKFVGK